MLLVAALVAVLVAEGKVVPATKKRRSMDDNGSSSSSSSAAALLKTCLGGAPHLVCTTVGPWRPHAVHFPCTSTGRRSSRHYIRRSRTQR